jgi:hypothetical protein
MDYEENQSTEQEFKPFNGKNLNRILAILFVAAIYVVIFLKILILQ